MHDGWRGVGIVGFSPGEGWAARAHVPALRVLPAYELVAVANSSPDSARAAAAAFGILGAYGDVTALARDSAVDFVVVTVKVLHHRALVEAAVTAGKTVFCEWSLGNGLAEARRMAEVASAAASRGKERTPHGNRRSCRRRWHAGKRCRGAIHHQGGSSRATNLRWEIDGTHGDQEIIAPGGRLYLLPLTLRGARGGDPALIEMPIPHEYRTMPSELSDPAVNVGELYAQLALGGRARCPVADFDAAVRRHRLVRAVETAAMEGRGVAT